MTRTSLASILRTGPAAVAEVSARLARRHVVLDCTAVDTLLPEQLEFLLADIPAEWDFVELGAVIDPHTMSPLVAQQLAAWTNRRHDRDVMIIPPGDQHSQEPATRYLLDTSSPLAPEPDLPPAASYPAAALRDQLEQLVRNDILGPADGPNEIIDERTVRGRYLVGMLAPRGSSGLPEEYDDAAPGGTDGEDGTADAPASKAAATMLPSSIGLTFAVTTTAPALRVTARWGRYNRVEIREEPYQRPDGGYRPVWQRTPVAETSPAIPSKRARLHPGHLPPKRPR